MISREAPESLEERWWWWQSRAAAVRKGGLGDVLTESTPTAGVQSCSLDAVVHCTSPNSSQVGLITLLYSFVQESQSLAYALAKKDNSLPSVSLSTQSPLLPIFRVEAPGSFRFFWKSYVQIRPETWEQHGLCALFAGPGKCSHHFYLPLGLYF